MRTRSVNNPVMDDLAPKSTAYAPQSTKRKVSDIDEKPRKAPRKQTKSVKAEKFIPVINLTADDDENDAVVVAEPKKANKSKTKAKKSSEGGEEKRLKKFRPKAPQSYYSYYERAVTQRLFALNRERGHNPDCPHDTADCPMESVDLAGSTGNVYRVTIGHVPTCTCPNFQNGNPQCKHIIYVLTKVLKTPDHLAYQLAFITSELREIFENAGPLPIETIDESDKDGKRKPVEGDCPICCCDLEPEAEEVVWCKAACGNNLHKTCFDQWKASRKGTQVTCPYCRTPWQTAPTGNFKDMAHGGSVGREGYVNVAHELGLDEYRDTSTYHDFWVRRQLRQGATF